MIPESIIMAFTNSLLISPSNSNDYSIVNNEDGELLTITNTQTSNSGRVSITSTASLLSEIDELKRKNNELTEMNEYYSQIFLIWHNDMSNLKKVIFATELIWQQERQN